MWRPEKLWPMAIVAVLVLTVALNIYVYRLANGSGAPVVERDYYRRAVSWDSTLAQARASAALGWTVEAQVGPLGRGGDARVAVQVIDRGGRPVDGAEVRAEALSNLDAGQGISAALSRDGAAGAYAAPMALRHAGLWELRLEVSRGKDRYFTSLRRDVGTGEATRSAP